MSFAFGNNSVFNSEVFRPRYMRSAPQTASNTPRLPPRYTRGGLIGSAPPPPPQPLTDAEIADRARAQGAAAGASASLGAATRIGEANQKANANAMNTASTMAAAPSSIRTEPAYPPRQTQGPEIPNDQLTPLKAPGPLTDFGRIADDHLMGRLNGGDAITTNARRTADTQASRNNYLTQLQSEEAAAQARFQPGTLQYQRLMDTGRANANTANLALQNQVNDLARQRSDEADALARQAEREAYSNAVGERNFQVGRADVKYQRGIDARDFAYKAGRDQVADNRAGTERQDRLNQQGVDNQFRQTAFDTQNSQWNTTNTQNQAEIVYQHQKDAQARQDALDAIKRGDIDGAINAVQGAKAKNYLLSVKAAGGDVLAALNSMFDNGTLKPEFRDATPAEDSLKGQADLVRIMHPDWDEERIQTEAIQRMIEIDSAKTQTVHEAALDRNVNQKLSSGQPLSDEEKSYAVKEGLINTFTAKTLPTGMDDIGDLIGQQINMDGKVYTVVDAARYAYIPDGGSYTRHKDYTVLEQGGRRYYVDQDGRITTTEPKDQR